MYTVQLQLFDLANQKVCCFKPFPKRHILDSSKLKSLQTTISDLMKMEGSSSDW